VVNTFILIWEVTGSSNGPEAALTFLFLFLRLSSISGVIIIKIIVVYS
jgi:hypothetical protein